MSKFIEELKEIYDKKGVPYQELKKAKRAERVEYTAKNYYEQCLENIKLKVSIGELSFKVLGLRGIGSEDWDATDKVCERFRSEYSIRLERTVLWSKQPNLFNVDLTVDLREKILSK